MHQAGSFDEGDETQLARRTYADTLEVKVLNFEGVATDRDGQRTPELTMKDFTLYVDDWVGRSPSDASPLGGKQRVEKVCDDDLHCATDHVEP